MGIMIVWLQLPTSPKLVRRRFAAEATLPEIAGLFLQRRGKEWPEEWVLVCRRVPDRVREIPVEVRR